MKLYNSLFLILLITSHYTYGAEVIQKINPMYRLVTHDTSFDIKVTIPNTDKKQDLVIGFISCELHKNAYAEITLINITNDYRHQKLGTKLVIKALEHMRNNGITTVRWLSAIEAMPFYDRFGARRIKKSMTNFEYIFDRDGDPEENLKKYYDAKRESKT